ncbi:MAG: ApaG domain-containing protein [Planctomycetes bacterium]|nr:ApaG domain-containing protein [Planctomycetota bacterium]
MHSCIILSRLWRLIDAEHRVTELRGHCVSGQRPELQPGVTYTFANEVQLASEWGSLEGSFRVLDETGVLHEIELDRRLLASPIMA